MPSLRSRSATRRGWLAAALGVVVVAVLLPLTIFLTSSWLAGWQLMSVLTGSMQPTYPVGSLLVIGQIDAAAVQPGMAIVFHDPAEPARLVAHRVIGIATESPLAFVTQGDANPARDPNPVPARLVRGHVLWSVSGLGTAMEWLQWPRSFLVLVLLPLGLLGSAELRPRIRQLRGRSKRASPAYTP
ncbi:MAG TPA: signal peptidase I [Candidatus Limnocylindrales bacterium]|nr:signal peptidase I [Candidatus Limnocylindrales bacterium]